MRSIGYAKVCCVLAASQEVSQESSTAHRRGYGGKSGSEMRTQSGRLDLFNSASLRLRRPRFCVLSVAVVGLIGVLAKQPHVWPVILPLDSTSAGIVGMLDCIPHVFGTSIQG